MVGRGLGNGHMTSLGAGSLPSTSAMREKDDGVNDTSCSKYGAGVLAPRTSCSVNAADLRSFVSITGAFNANPAQAFISVPAYR